MNAVSSSSNYTDNNSGYDNDNDSGSQQVYQDQHQSYSGQLSGITSENLTDHQEYSHGNIQNEDDVSGEIRSVSFARETRMRTQHRYDEEYNRKRKMAISGQYSPAAPLQACDQLDDNKLLARMKDGGLYAEIYMAPDIQTAAEKFPNLNDPSRFSTLKENYVCDNDCEYQAGIARSIMMHASRKSVTRKTSSRTHHTHSESNTWWHEEEWNVEQHWRGDRTPRWGVQSRKFLDQIPSDVRVELIANNASAVSSFPSDFGHTTYSNRRKPPNDKSLTSTQRRYNHAPWEIESENLAKNPEGQYQESASIGQEEIVHERVAQKERKRRNLQDGRALKTLNSGTAKGVIGTTVALECDDEPFESNTDSTRGYRMCQTCHAIRQLPDGYFPRVLNEVICAEDLCLRGEGTCRQRFLPFRILKNFGNKSCGRWEEISIELRTCCDCIVHPQSPFVKYVD